MENITKPSQHESKDYHSLPGLSNSRLKLLRRNPVIFQRAMEEQWEDDTKAHHIDGDMIDKMLLNYPSFLDNYIEQTWIVPGSQNQIEFAIKVAEDMEITEAYSSSYATNYKPATVAKKANELYNELYDYIMFLKSDDAEKTPYNERQKEMIMGIQKSAQNHPAVARMLDHPNKKDHVVFQETILGELFKCEVDLFLDLNKTVWNIDLKSTGSAIGYFPNDYRRYGYDRQQAIYYKCIRTWLDRTGRKDTRIRTGCIAVEKQEPFSTLLYEVHPRLLVKGWQWVKESVDMYKFHKEHGFDYPQRTLEKGMELLLPAQFDMTLLSE